MVTEGAGSPRAEYAQQLVTFAGKVEVEEVDD
jgi:hypothetical protein